MKDFSEGNLYEKIVKKPHKSNKIKIKALPFKPSANGLWPKKKGREKETGV